MTSNLDRINMKSLRDEIKEMYEWKSTHAKVTVKVEKCTLTWQQWQEFAKRIRDTIDSSFPDGVGEIIIDGPVIINY